MPRPTPQGVRVLGRVYTGVPGAYLRAALREPSCPTAGARWAAECELGRPVPRGQAALLYDPGVVTL